MDGFCHANPSLQEKARNALLYFLAMAMLVGIVDLKSSGLGDAVVVQLRDEEWVKKRLQVWYGEVGDGEGGGGYGEGGWCMVVHGGAWCPWGSSSVLLLCVCVWGGYM